MSQTEPAPDGRTGPPAIVKLDNYQDAKGRMVTECLPADGIPNATSGIPRFRGAGGVEITTPQGKRTLDITFVIHAESIPEAFAKFDEEAILAVKEINERARKRIVMPGPGSQKR